MKHLSSSRLGCHATSSVVNHLVVLLLLLIAINKFCFVDFVVYPHVATPPKSLEEAFEQTLNGSPNEQFTLIEIIQKNNIVTRTFECTEDEDLKARVLVKFIGEDAIDSGGVTRKFFSELFRGFGVYSILVRGTYPHITFLHNLEADLKTD